MNKPIENPLKEAGQTPTLDYFYEKEPDDLSDEELEQLVALHRAERIAFDAKEAKRTKKKEK